MTYKELNTPPASDRVSTATDHQLQQGLDAIMKGDAYRDRGDFDKAKAKYEKAARFYPSEAHDRLVILPLCKASMDVPDRFIPAGWRARAHHAKEKVKKQVWRYSAPVSFQKESFFPKPSVSTQCTSLSLSARMTTCTSTSQPTTTGLETMVCETVVSDPGTLSDVRTLTAAYKTADDEARRIIEKKIYDIIKEFGESQIITFDTVQELVVLADIQDPVIFLHIVTRIFYVLRDTPLLSSIALQGLAVILDLFPGNVDLGSLRSAFVEMLVSLQDRLHVICPASDESQVIPLLSALNALLDVMVRRNVVGLDREAVYNDLRTLLVDLTSHPNVGICFQALYAKQALAIIGNDESLPMSIFRRGKLAFLLAGNLFNLATKFDLANVESAYQNIKEIFEFSIQSRWYQGLIYVDYLAGQCTWWQLEDFVLRSKFHSDICFQLGVVLRLEQIAVVQTDVAVRDGAVRLLTALGENLIPLVPEMVQNTLRRLKMLTGSAGGAKNESIASNSNDLRPVWDPAWLAAPKGILFKAVQERDHRNATMDVVPAKIEAILQAVEIPPKSLEDIQSALKSYYERDLAILRVSGAKLDLETCFVNLAIVEAPAQREKEKQDLKEKAAVYHRIPSSEAVAAVNMQKPIPLEQLFNKRMLRDGREDIPKTILVQGRAGIGKTTLCKKLVHAHQTGLWRDRFDTVLWLPLRQIKAFKARTLEDLFREKYFSHRPKKEGKALARALEAYAQNHRVLFVLDGLDEIARDTRCDENLALREFTRILLLQHHVVVTSRPSGLDRSLLPPSIDLELETIVFNQQNVSDFVSKVLSPKAARTVQGFIQRNPLIRGLVNIPVQLDVICYSWDSLPTEAPTITMTGLYQLMVRKLWCKDAMLLGKVAGGMTLTQDQINQLTAAHMDRLMATELQHLGYLAFRGMENNHQIEFDAKDLLGAFDDLHDYHITDKSGSLPPQLVEIVKQTSFLHTADADLDPNKTDSQQAWYFLHLTFQEYFAATWVAQHLQQPSPTGMLDYFAATKSAHQLQRPLPTGMMTIEQAKVFVQEHKYNPRYEIMWWMVAGLLEGEALKDFFDLLQGAPRDLIGGRHQQILASCLNEARARLDTTIVTRLDAELMKWLDFECRELDVE
ncbi:hypothetical protein EC968_008576 [Mortierella alpina]|nr:hypothetical protein EC968_008576 [Mortierella alpina]